MNGPSIALNSPIPPTRCPLSLTIFTIGSRGDVQPYVALGQCLQAAGHRVRLATHAIFEPMIRAYGLDFMPVAGNPKAMIEQTAGRAWLESGRNPVRFAHAFSRLVRPLGEQILADAWAVCQGADAVLLSTLTLPAGHSVAEAMGIPACAIPLQPFTRTRAHPTLFLPTSLKLGGWFNWLTHVVAEQIVWQPFRAMTDHWRQTKLNLAPYPLSGPFQLLNRAELPVFYAFSPILVPSPPDWPTHVQATGYFFLDPLPGWQPPAELVTFLEAGPPPVYVGFGSMLHRNPQELTDIVVQALAQTGQRGILLSGWGNLRQTDLPPSILMLDSIPHAWLFPRMAAVVHHGGAGTTAAGLRAGVPGILTPFFADQFFWAERVYKLGVSPPPLPQKKLSVARLSQAIEQALGDPTMAARAQALGQRIRAERGAVRTALALDHWLSTGDRRPDLSRIL